MKDVVVFRVEVGVSVEVGVAVVIRSRVVLFRGISVKLQNRCEGRGEMIYSIAGLLDLYFLLIYLDSYFS